MKTRIVRYFKHIFFTVLVLTIISFRVLFSLGNSIKYNRNYEVNSENVDKEGPFIVYTDSSVSINYLQGTEASGFTLKQEKIDSIISAPVYYHRDSSTFNVTIDPFKNFDAEESTYAPVSKILAISDIEGGFGSFRKLLIGNKVVDEQLNWTFGNGHLVLVGDFIDRGYFVTQVLYLIYHLEQQALKAGGKVHYILGNHELMNMQGDHRYAASKYEYVAAILSLRQHQLYSKEHTLLGRWMNSKNIIEKIGDYVFTHGGLHPDFATSNLTIELINTRVRKQFDKQYYPVKENRKEADLLFSSEKSPYWYRGFFQDDLSTETIDSLLLYFEGTHIIVGHTIQQHVSTSYDGKIIGIDVQHPQEQWGSYFPPVHSEGLLIENGKFYRVNDEGARREL